MGRQATFDQQCFPKCKNLKLFSVVTEPKDNYFMSNENTG